MPYERRDRAVLSARQRRDRRVLWFILLYGVAGFFIGLMTGFFVWGIGR